MTEYDELCGGRGKATKGTLAWSPWIGVIKQAAFGVVALFLGATATVVAKPTLEKKVLPAVLQMLGRGEAMILYPSDANETPQQFTVYRYPFSDGVSGVLVGTEAAKDGSFQIFHLQGQARNGLMYFTFVPSDREENGGGAFLGSRDESKSDKNYVGVLYGVDKWKQDKTCVLHRFGAVMGPVSDVAKFPELLRKKGKSFAEADGPADDKTAFALAPCRQEVDVG